MKRKMLIIANPGERDAENYCEGVNQDGISAFSHRSRAARGNPMKSKR